MPAYTPPLHFSVTVRNKTNYPKRYVIVERSLKYNLIISVIKSKTGRTYENFRN